MDTKYVSCRTFMNKIYMDIRITSNSNVQQVKRLAWCPMHNILEHIYANAHNHQSMLKLAIVCPKIKIQKEK